VAEGVEREEELALLRELQCEQSQGYLHSRPLPVEEFEALLVRKPDAD
jgi:EAL domain-containing protein (putative c-di-GMP-specific phosphodiesterase class I)